MCGRKHCNMSTYGCGYKGQKPFVPEDTSMSSTIRSLTVNSASMSLQFIPSSAYLLCMKDSRGVPRQAGTSASYQYMHHCLSGLCLFLRDRFIILISRPDEAYDVPARALSVEDRAPNRSCTVMERIGIALRHGVRSHKMTRHEKSPSMLSFLSTRHSIHHPLGVVGKYGHRILIQPWHLSCDRPHKTQRLSSMRTLASSGSFPCNLVLSARWDVITSPLWVSG